MPNENLMFNTQNYPDMQSLNEGDEVTLTVNGRVVSNQGGNIEIETLSIETQANDAQKFTKDMSQQPGMEQPESMEG